MAPWRMAHAPAAYIALHCIATSAPPLVVKINHVKNRAVTQ